ncbi:DUF6503 family protein [Maribacter chungangensis]|uniref:DUF6503 family protein n=1 Tax=Maribacter chungangensis TaxID=1069117 RepID=A0ABW3AYW0_9FLAO
MTRYICILFALQLQLCAIGQELSGSELLAKAIAHHDPNGNWSTFKGALTVTMTTPNSSERTTKIILDFPGQFYSATVEKNGNTIISTLKKDSCSLMLNGSAEIPKVAQDSLRISCDRAKMMRDYYSYLYGLPMKLQDAGTNIYETVQKKTFKNKEYLVLKVDYDETVGKDTWYFYFDPKTYAMEVYQFYKDESQNDGEYILLTDTMDINGIKMPKVRAWYYNKDDGYLGTDTLTEVKKLE